MKKTLLQIISITIITLLYSCSGQLEQDIVITDADPTITKAAPSDFVYEPVQGITILGAKLTNPYSLNIMQAAMDSLSLPIRPIKLQPTDLYVRFLPADSTEFAYLLDEEHLELFDYPLDYELQEEGSYYHDPSIPYGEITWQYTTVKPDYVFPSGIQYEILEECYIPYEAAANAKGITATNSNVDMEELERLAYEMADLGDMWIDDKSMTRAAATYPSGRFTVRDTETDNFVPIKGVKIRVHNIVKWATTYTDANGDYTIPKKYRTNIHYAMVFQNFMGFRIWGNWAMLAPANHNMKWHSNSGISWNLDTNSGAWDWATTNNAVDEYYNICRNTGITPPPSDLSVWCLKNEGSSSAPMVPHLSYVNMNIQLLKNFYISFMSLGTLVKLFLPDIFIGTLNKSSSEIHETVFHELSHASHFVQVGSIYWNRYISYIASCWLRDNGNPYGDGTLNDNGVCEVGEMWGYAMEHIYGHEKYDGTIMESENYPGSTTYFFKPAIFWNIYKYGILNKAQIFAALTNDVDNLPKLRRKLISLYPSKADKIEILFADSDKYDKIGKWYFKNDSDSTVYLVFDRPWRDPVRESLGLDFIEGNSNIAPALQLPSIGGGSPIEGGMTIRPGNDKIEPGDSIRIAYLPYNDGKAYKRNDLFTVSAIAPTRWAVKGMDHRVRAVLDINTHETYGTWSTIEHSSGKERKWVFKYNEK